MFGPEQAGDAARDPNGRSTEALRRCGALLARIADELEDGIVLLDADGRVRAWSGAAHRLTGIEPAEALERSYEDVLPVDGAADPGLDRILARAAAAGRLRTRRESSGPDGRSRAIEQTVVALVDAGGDLVGYGLILREPVGSRERDERQRRMLVEAEEAKRTAEAVEERAAFLMHASRLLAASLDYGTTLNTIARLAVPRIADWCVVDVIQDAPRGEIRRIATAHVDAELADEMHQLRQRFPVLRDSGQPAARSIRTESPIYIPAVDDAELDRLALSEEHADLLRALGLHSIIAVPLVARGTVLGALTLVAASADRTYEPGDIEVAEELARRAAVAIDNARLYEAAVVANRAKSDFLAVMSHELRTPLTAVLGYAELLEMGLAGPTTDQQHRQIRRIEASANHLLELIEEILTFARLSAGEEESRTRRVDLADLVRRTGRDYERAAEENELALRIDVPDRAIPAVTDPDKVRRIILNLLSNAVKFTERGGGIRLGLHTGAHEATIEVADTGIGIAPERLGEIFSPFWQAEGAMTRRAGGTGLGLSVAQQFTELLGGRIEVESEPGRGSTFRVHLPLQSPERSQRG